MKFRLTFLVLIVLSIHVHSQSKNNLSLIYGTGIADMNIHGAIGDFGYESMGGKLYGLAYERFFTKSFSIETGLTFADNKVQLNSILPGHGFIPADELKLISVPILAKYSFLTVLFIDGGALIDFETNTPNNTSTYKQSGIGFELGLGAQYTVSHIHLFIQPYMQEHSAIPFNSSHNFNLMNAGYKFGLGYSF